MFHFRRFGNISAIGLVALLATPALGDDDANGRARQCQSFEDLTIYLEVNATDNDAEVVLLAKTEEDGLRSLAVLAPSGAVLATMAASRRSLGIREYAVESPEPEDINQVLRSYPAGLYRVGGKTIAGECVRGAVRLSHALAPTTEILTPSADDVVALDGFVVRWLPVAEAASYIISVDNETTGAELVAESPASSSSFVVPVDWLEPDNEYAVTVAVKATNGNVSSVEIVVRTLP